MYGGVVENTTPAFWGVTMKVYLFNPDTGVYFGEFVADEEPESSSSLLAPLKTTTIAPPEGGRGHIMVFDVAAQCWEVRTHSDSQDQEDPEPITPAKPPQKSIHCYSGSLLIFIGFLLLLAALCDDNKDISVMCGLSLMLGSAAYLSIKERQSDPSKNTWMRKYIEFAALLLIFIGYVFELHHHKVNNILLNSMSAVAMVLLYSYNLITQPRHDLVN